MRAGLRPRIDSGDGAFDTDMSGDWRLTSRNTDLSEQMDHPDCDPVLLERTFRSFSTVNRLLSGWGRVYRREIRPHLAGHGGPMTIMDVGCGGGDVLVWLVERARRDGFAVDGIGIDPDPRAIAFARAHRHVEGVRFEEMWLKDAAMADIVISNHMLHHLDDGEVVDMLRESRRHARVAVIHNDIRRGLLPLVLFQFLRPFFLNSFICGDGTLSIRRSFRPDELGALAGKPEAARSSWRLLRAGPFRTGLVWAAAS